MLSISNQYAPSKSAEAIANNNDLQSEIFIGLPVKSLVRFKSVSKEKITVYGVGFAFDPAKSPYYKVVFIRESSDYKSYQIEIYSSQTRSCRLSGNLFVAPFGTQFKGGVFCNGAIHWIDHCHTSLYFNVDEEKLGEMPTMPQIPEGLEERWLRYFGESRNHLHLIEIYGPRTTQFDIYEMESDYSSWEANDEESYMVLHIHGKAIHYNLKDGNFKKIFDLSSDGDTI
ncbi:hypothetical protein REPUB_Repub08aG0022200 [Reevesia pubescens]